MKAAVAEDGFDAVVAIGGEHTMSITRRLHEDGLPMIGVPKTIDNDVPCTDFTFGFDTAVQIATDAIDRLHTTAASHDRVMVIEVMGRNTGWIAVFSGIAGGADAIVIPELELTVEEIGDSINARHERGKSFSIVVVAEGAELAFASGEKRQVRASQEKDQYGYPRLGGIGQALGREIEERTGFETRVTTLGPRPARRDADSHRPRAGHPLRGEGGGARDRRGVRPDGGAARDRDDQRPALRRGGHQADRPRPTCGWRAPSSGKRFIASGE